MGQCGVPVLFGGWREAFEGCLLCERSPHFLAIQVGVSWQATPLPVVLPPVGVASGPIGPKDGPRLAFSLVCGGVKLTVTAGGLLVRQSRRSPCFKGPACCYAQRQSPLSETPSPEETNSRSQENWASHTGRLKLGNKQHQFPASTYDFPACPLPVDQTSVTDCPPLLWLMIRVVDSQTSCWVFFCFSGVWESQVPPLLFLLSERPLEVSSKSWLAPGFVPTLIWRGLLRSECSLPQGTGHSAHLPSWNLRDTPGSFHCGVQILPQAICILECRWSPDTNAFCILMVPWGGKEKGVATPGSRLCVHCHGIWKIFFYPPPPI